MDVYWLLLWMTNVLIAFICPLVSSLQCYYSDESNSKSDCGDSMRVCECPDDMDSCSIQAVWYGDLYTEMRTIRSCMSSSLCPSGSANSNGSSCVRNHQGLSCTMCCQEDRCNNGASGPGFPRPPPKPPAPQTLVERLISPCVDIGNSCENTLTWADYDTRLHVKKECKEKKQSSRNDAFLKYTIGRELECNIKKDDTFCVTCCAGEDCNASTASSMSNMMIMSLLSLLVLYIIDIRIP